MIAKVGEAREDHQSAGGDAIHVVAGEEVAAAQLAHAEIPDRAFRRPSHLQTDHTVRDREFG